LPTFFYQKSYIKGELKEADLSQIDWEKVDKSQEIQFKARGKYLSYIYGCFMLLLLAFFNFSLYLFNKEERFVGFMAVLGLFLLLFFRIYYDNRIEKMKLIASEDKIIIRKKGKTILIPFAEIKTIQPSRNKLVTTNGKYHIPYGFMVDLPVFFRLLQANLEDRLSAKVNKKIELFIKNYTYYEISRKTAFLKSIFSILSVFITIALIELLLINSTFLFAFPIVMSGIIFLALAEIVYYLAFSKQYKIEKESCIGIGKNKTLKIYGIFFLMWLLFLRIVFLLR
jgi:hypothetical protein